MDSFFVISLFLSIYGIVGVFGLQIIQAKYRGHDWTKSYIRRQGISWLLLGVPWLIFDRAVVYSSADVSNKVLCLVLLALAIPSMIFSLVNDKKYKSMLKNAESK